MGLVINLVGMDGQARLAAFNMSLPYFQSTIREFTMLETQWKSQLDPVIANPTTNPLILKNISVTSGSNVINHKLGRTQQGWFIVDINAPVTLYRSQPFNDLTLTLTSSGSAVISLAVF
jgi:hypothetical protein